VIFTSGKAKSFNAGADLFEIRKMSREQLTQYSRWVNRYSTRSPPAHANGGAINGDCLGGGCELRLACKFA